MDPEPSFDDKKLSAWVKRLGSEKAKPYQRVRAAQVLKTLGPYKGKVVPALGKALSDPDEMVRDAAAEALIAFGPKAEPAVPTLVAALGDSNKVIAGKAAHALGAIGPPAKDAADALEKACFDGDERLSTAATEALKAILGDAFVPPERPLPKPTLHVPDGEPPDTVNALQEPGIFSCQQDSSQLIYVPPGKYTQGSENGGPDELPPHEVKISVGFFISKYEVTLAQYRDFCEATGRKPPQRQPDTQHPSQPAVGVDW